MSRVSWGDNGAARPVTKQYADNFDKIDWSKGRDKGAVKEDAKTTSQSSTKDSKD